jgi:hypothetical protein
MDDPMRRAERYRQVAEEYGTLADGAASPSFEPTFYRSPNNTASMRTASCRSWRRMARRSPANCEQILNVGMTIPNVRLRNLNVWVPVEATNVGAMHAHPA